MRIIFLFLLLLSFGANAQTPPINATNGSPGSTVLTKGTSAADSGYWLRTNFADSNSLNIGILKNVPGLIVRIGDTAYMRNNSATAWLNMMRGGGGSGGSGWGLTGNAFTDPLVNFLGTTDATDLVFRTNNLPVATFGGSDYNFGFGFENIWTGPYSMAIGRQDTSTGSTSFAVGFKSKASGDQSIALGNGSKATATASVSVGSGNLSSGAGSFASGIDNIASGSTSTATGGKDTASGNYSFVAGFESKASGLYSFAQGHESIASGVVSIAMGNGAVSTGYGATTFGKGFTNAKDTSFAVGFTTRKLEVSPDSVIISPTNVFYARTKKIEHAYSDSFYLWDYGRNEDRVLIDNEKSTFWGPGAQSRINVYGDTVELSPTASTGKLLISNIYQSANADDSMLVRDASSGFIGYRAIPSTSVPLSGITAATATNNINNGNFNQSWSWNSLQGQALVLSSSSASSPTTNDILTINLSGNHGTTSSIQQRGLVISNSATGTGTGQIKYGIYSSVSGASPSNIAGQFIANGGTLNTGIVAQGTQYAALFSTGSVGIGTSTPDSLLTVTGGGLYANRGVRFTGLASSANATDSMMVVNASNGNVGWRAIPSGGTVASASGSGISLVNGSSQIKRLKAGSMITITDNTDSVTIASEWTRVSISSDQTTSATTGTNITGLSFSVSANTKYEIRAVLVMETNASTTGYGVGFTFPASCTGSCRIIQPNDNTSVGTIYNGLFSGVPNPTASNVPASSSYADATIHSMLNVAGTSGTVQLQFHAENGSGGSATVKTGSYVEYRTIN